MWKGWKGGNKKERKKDCARGKKEETEKEYLLWKGKKGRNKKRKIVQGLEMKKQKRDTLERTSLNGYDE